MRAVRSDISVSLNLVSSRGCKAVGGLMVIIGGREMGRRSGGGFHRRRRVREEERKGEISYVMKSNRRRKSNISFPLPRHIDPGGTPTTNARRRQRQGLSIPSAATGFVQGRNIPNETHQ